MPKECTLCGYSPEPPAKPEGENEDCPKCGGKGTVRDAGEEEDEE